MSVKNGQTENLKEEVVVEETTELVEMEETTKKEKAVKLAKKVGKIAGIAGIGILGYILGSKSSRGSSYDDSEIVYDVENSEE